jgi:hypothetical protein
MASSLVPAGTPGQQPLIPAPQLHLKTYVPSQLVSSLVPAGK